MADDIAFVLSTAPAERDAAEEAFASLYEASNLGRPRVTWALSPVQAIVLARQQGFYRTHSMLRLAWPLTMEQTAVFRGASPRAARASGAIRHVIARAGVESDWAWRSAGEYSLDRPFRFELGDEAMDALIDSVHGVDSGWFRTWVGDRLASAARRASTRSAFASGAIDGGMMDEGWLSLFHGGQLDWLYPAIGDDHGSVASLDARGRRRLNAFIAIGRACGPWLGFDGAVVACERPLALATDDQDRPHRIDGPAIVYPDGLTVHAIEGTPVPSLVTGDPSEITIADIDRERNAEVRRLLLERFGHARFIREGGAELLDESEHGRLWRRATPRANGRTGTRRAAHEPVVMVEVVDATPQADGTRRTYFLRVPPTMRSAQAAVAWTFGLQAREYRPDVET